MVDKEPIVCQECGGAAEFIAFLPDLLDEGGFHVFKCDGCGNRIWRRYRPTGEPPKGRAEEAHPALG